MLARSIAFVALLALLAGLLAAPIAAAAEASAYVQPPLAAAGDPLSLVYTVRATSAVELRALDDVRCAITGPDAATLDCEPFAELVDVRAQGAERSYVFDLVAPAIAGKYAVAFTRTATAALAIPPGGSDGAEAAFEVRAPAVEEIDLGGATPTDVVVPERSEDPADPSHGGRWLATMFMATGAATSSIVLARRGSGGT